jgi:hypothetical protein
MVRACLVVCVVQTAGGHEPEQVRRLRLEITLR